MIEAGILASVAAGIALALAYGLQRLVAANLAGLTFLPWTWCAAFCAGAVVLAWLAATFVIGRILRHVGA